MAAIIATVVVEGPELGRFVPAETVVVVLPEAAPPVAVNPYAMAWRAPVVLSVPCICSVCVPLDREAGMVTTPEATPVASADSVAILTGLEATHTSAVLDGLRPKTRTVTVPPAFIERTTPVPEVAALTSPDTPMSILKVEVPSTLRMLLPATASIIFAGVTVPSAETVRPSPATMAAVPDLGVNMAAGVEVVVVVEPGAVVEDGVVDDGVVDDVDTTVVVVDDGDATVVVVDDVV